MECTSKSMRILAEYAEEALWPCAAMVDNVIAVNEGPTRHAEILILEHIKGTGHTLRVTAEPCPMCMAAIMWSGKIDRVEYGTSIPRLIELGHYQSSIRAQEVIDSFPAKRKVELVQVAPDQTDHLYRR